MGGALQCIVVCPCGSCMSQDFVWLRLRSVEIGVTKVFFWIHMEMWGMIVQEPASIYYAEPQGKLE